MLRKLCYGLAALVFTATHVVAQPANDLCVNSEPISGFGSFNFDTTGATSDINSACSYLGNNFGTVDVWYEYTATTTGLVRFETTDGCAEGFDPGLLPQISAYNTCGGPLVTCSASTCSNDSEFAPLMLSVVSGQKYMLRVATYSQLDQIGPGTVTVTAVSNDLCVNATPLILDVPFPFDTTGATNTLSDVNPSCLIASTNARIDVWFEYTPSITGENIITLIPNPTSFGPKISVYSNCGGGGALLACLNASTGSASYELNFPGTAGQKVYIRVGASNDTPRMGTIKVSTSSQPPANDLCTSATPLTSNVPAVFDTNNGTNTSSAVVNTCLTTTQAEANDVWFSYTPNGAGLISVTVTPSPANYTPNISVYDSCNGGSLLACARTELPSSDSRVILSVMPAQTVHIRVGADDNIPRTGTIEVAGPAAPISNDNCGGAITLTDGETLAFSNAFATNSNLASCSVFSTDNYDVWYRFVPSQDGRVFFSTCGSENPFRLTVFSDFCGAVLACGTDEVCSGPVGQMGFATIIVTAGDAVYARLSSFAGKTGNGQIRADLVATPPGNDLCANAVSVGAGTVDYDTYDATNDGSASCSNPLELVPGPDVWYRFTPAVTGYADFEVADFSGESQHGAYVTLYEECGGAQLFCQSEQARVSVTAGQSVVVRVSSGGSQLVRGTLSITEHSTTPSQYVESNTDSAGDLANSAVDLSGRTGLAEILGALQVNERADVYKVRICRPTQFSVTGIQNIFIFNEQGIGVVATTRMLAGVGNTLIPSAGIYYLAVSGRPGTLPIDNASNRIWNNVQGADRAPDGPGAGNAFANWVGSGLPFSSYYTLTLAGLCECTADFNNVNGVTVQDIFDFLTAWLAGSPTANFNGVNGVTVQDIFDFLTAWLP